MVRRHPPDRDNFGGQRAGAKSFRFKDGDFPALVIGMEHGNPVHVPDQFSRESNPKGKPMREREWDVGKSKGLPVMGSIGIEPEGDIIPRESGQTSNGSFFARSTGGLFNSPCVRIVVA